MSHEANMHTVFMFVLVLSAHTIKRNRRIRYNKIGAVRAHNLEKDVFVTIVYGL